MGDKSAEAPIGEFGDDLPQLLALSPSRSQAGAGTSLEQRRCWLSRIIRHWLGTAVASLGCAAAVAGYQHCQGTGPLARSPRTAGDVRSYVGRLVSYGALACVATNMTALYLSSAMLNADWDTENGWARRGWAAGTSLALLSLVPFSGRALWMKAVHLTHDLPLAAATAVGVAGGGFLWYLLRGVTPSHVTFGLRSISWKTFVNSFAWPTSTRGLYHIWCQVWKRPLAYSEHNQSNEAAKNDRRDKLVLYNPTLYAPLERVFKAPEMGRFAAVATLADEQLFVNGTFCLESVRSCSTCSMAQHAFDPFHVVKDSKGPIAHVTDAGTGMICWYSLAPPDFGVEDKRHFFSITSLGILPDVTEEEGGNLLAFLSAAEPGSCLASLVAGHHLSAEERLRLCIAEILVPEGFFEKREREVECAVGAAQELYRSKGICRIPMLLPPFMLDAFRTYMLRLRETCPERMNETSSRYLFMWTDEVAMMFNCFFLELVQRVVGEKLVSTKCISLYYPKGALLDVHVDSLPFVVAMSISLEWDTPEGEEAPCLAVVTGSLLTPLKDIPFRYGEAVIFAGHRLPHYRDPSPTDAISISFSWNLAN